MATLAEIWTLLEDPALKEKVSAACLIAAETVRTEDAGTANHANRLIWAKQTFKNPVGAGQNFLKALLAANSTLTVAQLQGATDAAIQTAVNNAVNIFADGVG